MNYIVIDLEWNQCPVGETEKENFPFEIIEIGAVKLDENREITESFHELICPQIYKDIHPKTNEIIHMDIEELQGGDSFVQVMERFFQWCGENYYFATWGPNDLPELQRNMEYYDLPALSEGPFVYYDVQKLFSIFTEGRKNAKTLEYAVDYFGIEKNLEFHRAIWDAQYTAGVLQRLDKEVIDNYYSIDFYHPPKTKADEVYVVYKDYAKRISCGYHTKEELMADKDMNYMVCSQCGKRAAKKIRWFSSNMKNYSCLALCREHGYLKGKIRFHKTRDGKVFAVKIVKPVSEEKADLLRSRYLQIRERKKVKRRTQNKKRR